MTRKAKKWLSALAIGLITLTIGVTQYDLDSGWAALSSRLNDRLMAMFVDVAGFQKTGVRITFATESSARLPSRINDRWFQAFASCGSGQTCLRVVDVGPASAPVDAQYVTLALDATLSAERVLTGTANQITITDGGANTTVTLSLPQDIALTSSPTFASLSLNDAVNQIVLDADGADTGTITLAALSLSRTYTFPDASGEISLLGQTIDLTTEVTGTLPVGNGGMGATSHTDGAILLGNAAGAITNLGVLADDTLVLGDGVTDPGTALLPDCNAVDEAINYDVPTNTFSCQTIVGSAAGAPTGASYVVLGLDATLTAERVLTGTTDQITITDGGANTTVTLSLPQDIALTSSPTFVNLNLDNRLNHTGDADTFIDFNTDEIEIQVGGIFFARLTEAVTDVFTINPNAGDVNFIVETLTVIDALTIDAGADTAAFNVPLTVNDILDARGAPGTVLGGFASGGMRVTNPSTTLNANAVITGHNLNATNTQLWYLGSTSSSNNDIGLFNRQNGSLTFFTNNTQRINIEASGTVVINELGIAGANVRIETDTVTDAFQIVASSDSAKFNVPLTTNNIFFETDSTFDIGTTTVRAREIFTDAITITGASLKLSADGLAGDVILARDAANILALRNGLTRQTFHVYNTFTDASNFERGKVYWDASNVWTIEPESLGTGSDRSMRIGTTGSSGNLQFQTANTDRLSLSGASGNLLWSSDNSNDIGNSSTTFRPRNIFAGTLLSAPTLNLLAATNQIVLDSDGTFTGTLTMASLAASRVYTFPDGTITLAGLELAQEYTSQQNFNATTLTDAVNISWNLNTNQVASVTLAGNRTLDNPTNQVDGSTYVLIVKQDGVGSRTLVYGTAYKFSGGTAPVLSTGINAVDILTFISDGTNMFGVIVQDFS